MDRQFFGFTPVGKVRISFDWGCQKQSFEDGTRQYYRKRIHPRKSYSFTVAGTDVQQVLRFYNNAHGALGTFYFIYDGKTEICRFAGELKVQCFRENGKNIGFSCGIELIVESSDWSYNVVDEVLPVSTVETMQQLDWNVGKTTIGVKDGYYEKQKKATRIISGTWSGTKDVRDKLIGLYITHCRKAVDYTYAGEKLKVSLPDKLEITDNREAGRIVGFECTMDLEVVS